MTLVSLYLFSIQLHNISITPKMVKKVITYLDSSKASRPDYVTVVLLKNCEPDLSNILAKLFIMCLKVSCFPDCWKISSKISSQQQTFHPLGERSAAKNYIPVSLFSVLLKTLKNL